MPRRCATLRQRDEVVLGGFTKLVFTTRTARASLRPTPLSHHTQLAPAEHHVLVELIRPLYEGALFSKLPK